MQVVCSHVQTFCIASKTTPPRLVYCVGTNPELALSFIILGIGALVSLHK